MNEIEKAKSTLINNLKIFKEKERSKGFNIMIMNPIGKDLAKSIQNCKHLKIDTYSIINKHSNYSEKQINELFKHWEEEWERNPQLK